MKVHEYQAKQIFRDHGIAVPEGKACFSAAEAAAAAKELGGEVWVVKAQIHAGGRGKGGGVKVCRSIEEVEEAAGAIFGMQLVTHQTGPEGQQVRRLLVEQGAAIARELYLGMVIDRQKQQAVVMASSEGGMDIEEVAATAPDKILKTWIDPKRGIDAEEAKAIAAKMDLPAASCDAFAALAAKLHAAFAATDASLLEINPLVLLEDGGLIALDAKLNLDENALFRHPELLELKDQDEEDPAEARAAKFGLSYIALDGDIGCMVNGAGLAMATMDAIKLKGGAPANFLDVGGGATKENVTEAFKIMLANPSLKAILVNIFGGIMRCDVIAEGVVAAARDIKLTVPLVVRLEGTNVDKGKAILADSGLAIIAADDMDDAARKAVESAT
ncbi:MAG: ADP-forming succinate--CoA ligase subunit beta [Betaproteobacteria bacterium AqS2]|uniref:Succinate--CoA ligase [ADP-forming] subunit beta n=1 Tax=Candidatus Amphirhobacter heronislandensis TaxID=1732024 RepID=A0A930Y1A3_9GAMM|nr:ADP-forming succinate--CoA ligase subunit beta [Betaproteobacteria bacterium AqS2]